MQYSTQRHPFYLNLSISEWTKMSQILKDIRSKRDERLAIMKENMMADTKELASLQQITVYDITYLDPASQDEQTKSFFELESAIDELVSDGYKIINSNKRKVALPTLPSVALMFATLLLRCQKDKLIAQVDHMMLAHHIQEFYKQIKISPHLENDILSVSNWALQSQ